jgi:hypothetical protein
MSSQPSQIQPLAPSVSPIHHQAEASTYETAELNQSQEATTAIPVAPVVKLGGEESGSDSGHDVRSPASVHEPAINSSSPTSHQSNTSSGYAEASQLPPTQHQPFLSYPGAPFYQHQYGYLPLDMSGYPQYPNIYSNQG